MEDRRRNHYARKQFDGMRNDLARRLSAVCGHLQQSELAELVANMIRLQIRFAGVSAVPRKRS